MKQKKNVDLLTLKATPLTSKQQNLPKKRRYAVSSVVSSIAPYQLSTQIGGYNGVVPITADGWLAMIIPVAIVAITATWALSSRGLEALAHSQIARGNINQNIVLCALINKAQIMQEGRCGVSTRPTRRQHVKSN